MANKMHVMKEYEDGLIIQWNNQIWAIKDDGDQPSLWPVATITRQDGGVATISIPKGTDVDNANAVLSILGIGNLF